MTEITDPEVLAYIRHLDHLGAGFDTPDVGQMRADYDRKADAMRYPRPAGITVSDGEVPGQGGAIPIRTYRPESAAATRVLYFHGGGFVLGGLDTHDDVCAELAAQAGAEVVSVDYRLAPEHRHPAHWQDAISALEATEGPVVTAGDSAGGLLAAALAQHAPDRVVGQVLIYPLLGGVYAGLTSYEERGEAPMLTTAAIHAFDALRADGEVPRDDATFSPLVAPDLSGQPPAFVSVAEFDPIRDDGVEYARRLREAGVDVELVVEDQLPHSHMRARFMSARAGGAFERIAAATRRLVRR